MLNQSYKRGAVQSFLHSTNASYQQKTTTTSIISSRSTHPVSTMSSHVLMVKNPITGRFISFDGSDIVTTLTQSTADNFIVEQNGTDRFLRPYNSASDRLLRIPESQCEQGLDTSPTGSVIHTSPGGTNTGVKVFVMDNTTLEKWYLRVHMITREVSLECQTALDNVSG